MKRIGAQRLGKTVARVASQDGLAVDRVRRWIGAGALIQTLTLAKERGELRFLIKGGHSVELRFPERARASEDIDIAIADAEDIAGAVERALPQGWSDFSFELKGREQRPNSLRLRVQVRLNGVDWCTLKIDLVVEDRFVVEPVPALDTKRFGLPPLEPVPCLSRPQQMAQWIHAITKPAAETERRDRSRNILDLYLFDRYAPCDDADILSAILETFSDQPTHAFPPPTLALPADWLPGLDLIASELELDVTGSDLAHHFKTFIHRLLGVPMRQNYEYMFVVLTPVQSVPGPLSGVFNINDVAYQNFEIQTKQNGFRVASIIPYPGAQRALIAVLERPVESAS